MNMRLFTIFSGLALAALSGCVVVGSTPGTGGSGGAGGGDAATGTGGAGGGTTTTVGVGGSGGGAAACSTKVNCADATTTNDANLPPCALDDMMMPDTSAQILADYIACVCKQPSCMSGGTDPHKICDAMPDYDAVPGATCQGDIDANCKTELGACTSDF